MAAYTENGQPRTPTFRADCKVVGRLILVVLVRLIDLTNEFIPRGVQFAALPPAGITKRDQGEIRIGDQADPHQSQAHRQRLSVYSFSSCPHLFYPENGYPLKQRIELFVPRRDHHLQSSGWFRAEFCWPAGEPRARWQENLNGTACDRSGVERPRLRQGQHTPRAIPPRYEWREKTLNPPGSFFTSRTYLRDTRIHTR